MIGYIKIGGKHQWKQLHVTKSKWLSLLPNDCTVFVAQLDVFNSQFQPSEEHISF
jgi:hypothetical protein